MRSVRDEACFCVLNTLLYTIIQIKTNVKELDNLSIVDAVVSRGNLVWQSERHIKCITHGNVKMSNSAISSELAETRRNTGTSFSCLEKSD